MFANSVSLLYTVLQHKLSYAAHKLHILLPCGPKF